MSAGALSGIDTAVLAGGLGTRIRPVLGDVPTVLAPVGGRPCLDPLLDWLAGQGAGRVVLCLGHLAGRVTAHLAATPRRDLDIVPVIEPEPLGTAGALRFARTHLRTDPVLALNGDTFLEADLAAFVARHRAERAKISLMCVEVPSVARYGSVELDGAGRVGRFAEKAPVRDGAADRPGLVSGGMTLLSAGALDDLAALSGPSFERDFLQVQPVGSILAGIAHGRFIDIGTPPSLARAAHVVPGAVPGTIRRQEPA